MEIASYAIVADLANQSWIWMNKQYKLAGPLERMDVIFFFFPTFARMSKPKHILKNDTKFGFFSWIYI